MGLNIVIEYVTATPVQPYKIGKSPLSHVRAFMDDLNILYSSLGDAKSLLSRCSSALKWAGMQFRPDKSWSKVAVFTLLLSPVQKTKPFHQFKKCQLDFLGA